MPAMLYALPVAPIIAHAWLIGQQWFAGERSCPAITTDVFPPSLKHHLGASSALLSHYPAQLS